MISYYTDNRAGGNVKSPVAVRTDGPASVNGSIIAERLNDTQLRYVVQLAYTGYPVAALAMGQAALDLAAHLNIGLFAGGLPLPYNVWDLHTKSVYTGLPSE